MDNTIFDTHTCVCCNSEFIETDRTAIAPCCGRVAHTQCMIQMVARNIIRWNDVICFCGQNLYLFERETYIENRVAEDQARQAILEERKKNPEYKKHFIELKKLGRERLKAMKELKSYVRGRVNEYKIQIQTSINIIKTAKVAMITLMKNSPEFKKYRSSCAKYTSNYNRFRRMYNLNDMEMRAIFSVRRRVWRRWSSQPSWIIGRPLRVRI
jgi:hypothetical protein